MKALIIYIIIYLFELSINYIVLPFNIQKKSIDKTLSLEKQLQYFIEKDNVVSYLSFGSSQKQLELAISFNEYRFFLSNDYCLQNSISDYNPFLSNTFKNTTDYKDIYPNIKKYCRAIDKSIFFNDIYLDKKIEVDNVPFLLGVNMNQGKINNNSKVCGVIGLSLFNKYSNEFRYDYFIHNLKSIDIINSYTMSLLYLNDTIDKNSMLNYTNSIYDGILICGINNNDYISIFKNENLKTIYSDTNISNFNWDINQFIVSYDYLGENFELLDNKITFNNQINYITCTKTFFENLQKSMFKKYLNDNTCNITETLGKKIISCEKNIKEKISEFPNILLSHNDLDFIYELTYKDLFIELNERYIFLIIYNSLESKIWTLGNIFLKKYNFVFDYDKKTITFVNIFNKNKSDNKKDENNNSNFAEGLKIFVIIFLIILAVFLGIFIGKNIYKNKKKKRANELNDDDYDYTINEDKDPIIN